MLSSYAQLAPTMAAAAVAAASPWTTEMAAAALLYREGEGLISNASTGFSRRGWFGEGSGYLGNALGGEGLPKHL